MADPARSSGAGRRGRPTRQRSRVEEEGIRRARERQITAQLTGLRKAAAAQLLKLGDATTKRRETINKRLSQVRDMELLRQIRDADEAHVKREARNQYEENPWWYH